MRAYNRGKPFTGLTPFYGTTPLLKGISTSLAKKLQYDIPIYWCRRMISHAGTRAELVWYTTTPQHCRRFYEEIGVNWIDHMIEEGGIFDVQGFAIEVDPPKPEYESDAQ